MKRQRRHLSPLAPLLAAALALVLSACTQSKSKDDELENQPIAINTSNFREALVRCSLKAADRANTTTVSCSLFRPTRRGESPFSGRDSALDIRWEEPPQRLSGSRFGLVRCSYRNDRLTQDCDVELVDPQPTDVRFQAAISATGQPTPHVASRVETLPFTIRTYGVAPRVPLAFRPDTLGSSTAQFARRVLGTTDSGEPGFQVVPLPMNRYYPSFHVETGTPFCTLRGRLYVGGVGSIMRIEGANGGAVTNLADSMVHFVAGHSTGTRPEAPTSAIRGLYLGNWNQIACREGDTEANDILYSAYRDTGIGNKARVRVVKLAASGTATFFNSEWLTDTDLGELSAAALDPQGNLLLLEAKHYRLYKMTPQGVFSPPRQLLPPEPCTLDGQADTYTAQCTRLADGGGLAISPRDGTVYVSLMARRKVYRLPPTGYLVPIAGTGRGYAGTLKPATGDVIGAALDQPIGYVGGITALSDGSLLIANMARHEVYRLRPDGNLVHFLGAPEIFAAGTDDRQKVRRLYLQKPFAVFEWKPGKVLVGGEAGSLYSVNYQAGEPTSIHQVAGGLDVLARDGTNVASHAEPGKPVFGVTRHLSVDRSGRLLVPEVTLQRVLRLERNGERTIARVVAGAFAQQPLADNTHPTSGSFVNPMAVVERADGALLVAERGNYELTAGDGRRIRLITNPGTDRALITTIAGNGIRGTSGEGVEATAGTFVGPDALAIDAAGNVYVADNLRSIPGVVDQEWGILRKLQPSGGGYTIHTVAGNATAGPIAANVLGGEASPRFTPLPPIESVGVGPDGAVFFASPKGGLFRIANDRLKQIAGGGDSVEISPGMDARRLKLRPTRISVSARGEIYVIDDNFRLLRLVPGPGDVYGAHLILDARAQGAESCGSGVLRGAGEGAEAMFAGLRSVCVGALWAIAVDDRCQTNGGEFTLYTGSLFDLVAGSTIITAASRRCGTDE